MTLTELADKLKEIFEFDYLTINDSGAIYIWRGARPKYKYDTWECDFHKTSIVLEVFPSAIDIDLSEYTDENGNIDYSKCIVEVD